MKMIANHATNIITIECKEIYGTYNTCLEYYQHCTTTRLFSLETGNVSHYKRIDCHCHKRKKPVIDSSPQLHTLRTEKTIHLRIV